MDLFLGALRRAVRSHPGLLVVAALVLSGVFGALSGQQVQQQGFENFVPDNPAARASQRIADEFQGAKATVAQVAVFADGGGDVLSPAGIAAANEIRRQLQANPTVAAALADRGGQPAIMTYADLVLRAAQARGVDPATLDDDAIDQLYTAALRQLPEAQRGQVATLLGGEVQGGDATAGMVLVFLQGDSSQATGATDQSPVVRKALLAMGDLDVAAPGYDVRPFNFELLSNEVNEKITSQLSKLLGVAFLLIILILIAIYRNALDVVVSLVGLGMTIVWMQGISTLLGPAFLGWTGGMSEMAMAIPILLIGLGVDYGIHLTMRYREERGLGEAPVASADRAIGAVGVALLLATITTVVGFLTNLTNPLPPLRDFGVFAAVGVASAFIIMLTFVPAVRLLVDRWRDRRGSLKPVRVRDDGHPSLLGRLSAEFTPYAVHHPWKVLAVAGVVTLVGAGGATQLSTQFSNTDFFPRDSQALKTVNEVTDAFGGDVAESTSVLVEGDVATPAALQALVAFQQGLADDADVRTFDGRPQVESVLSRIQQIAMLAQQQGQQPGQAQAGDQATGGQATGQGQTPAVDPAAIATLVQQSQAAGILGGGQVSDSADVGALYDALLAVDPTAASLLSPDGQGGYDATVVRVSTTSGDTVSQLVDDLNADAQPLTGAGLDVSLTSDPILINTVMTELQASQVRSLVYTLVASMLILALVFWFRERKPMLGVLAILSVAVVVAWVLGLMAAVGIPFNVMTAMVSALAIGIGVPFGIHVVNRFLEDRRRHPDTFEAMRLTLQHTGGALVGSALTTIAGFGVLMLSSVPPMQQFGFVTAVTIGFALLSSIIVLPAMLALWARRHAAPVEAGDGDRSREAERVAGV